MKMVQVEKSKVKLSAVFALLAVLFVLVTALVVKAAPDDGMVWNLSSGDGVATKDSYYMVDFITQKICSYNYKTQQKELLCSKPKCNHRGSPCVACSAAGSSNMGRAFVVLGDTVYCFKDSCGGQMYIVAVSISTRERRVIAKDTMNTVTDIVAMDGKIYYGGYTSVSRVEPEGCHVLYNVYAVHCLDLKTNAVYVIINRESDPHKKVLFRGANREYIYFLEMTLNNYKRVLPLRGSTEIYSCDENYGAKLKKISLKTLEEITITDAMSFVFDYYDTRAMYFEKRTGHGDFEVCRLDYKSGEVEKLFNTDCEIGYMVADENRLMYAPRVFIGEKLMAKDCVVFDRKEKTLRDVHFTDEGYRYFAMGAEYGDFFIGDLVYENRQFKIQIKKDDLFSGKSANISGFAEKEEYYEVTERIICGEPVTCYIDKHNRNY